MEGIYNSLEDALRDKVEILLDKYLENMKEVFPKVSTRQKEQWRENIEIYMMDQLEDSEVFWDNMPENINPK